MTEKKARKVRHTIFIALKCWPLALKIQKGFQKKKQGFRLQGLVCDNKWSKRPVSVFMIWYLYRHWRTVQKSHGILGCQKGNKNTRRSVDRFDSGRINWVSSQYPCSWFGACTGTAQKSHGILGCKRGPSENNVSKIKGQTTNNFDWSFWFRIDWESAKAEH